MTHGSKGFCVFNALVGVVLILNSVSFFLSFLLSHSTAENTAEPPSAPKAPVSPCFMVPATPLSSGTCKPSPAPSSSPAEHKVSPKPSQAEPSTETEEEKAKKLLYCSLCKVAVNSLSQLEAHNTGALNIWQLSLKTFSCSSLSLAQTAQDGHCFASVAPCCVRVSARTCFIKLKKSTGVLIDMF